MNAKERKQQEDGGKKITMKRNVSFKWLTSLLHIRDVLGSVSAQVGFSWTSLF
jgi:hypothetical protein